MKRKLFSLLICLILLAGLCPPVQAYNDALPRIVDFADLLTVQQESSLETVALELYGTYDMDVVILTVDSLGSKSARSYAEEFYDGNGYGADDAGSGVILLLAMETREWYISTCGNAMDAISDYDVDNLFEVMADDLSAGDYYGAFSNYLNALPGYFGSYHPPGNGSHPSGSNVAIGMQQILIALGVGLACGGIGLLILRGMMNTKHAQRGAGDYLEHGSYDLRVQRDIFLYSRVTKTPRPKESSTSSGGRSGGGGRSHGGGGGRF